MTQQEKRTAQLNKVLNAIKDKLANDNNKAWADGWLHELNMTGFFYSCGRLNDMQVLTKLIFAGIACGMEKNDFMKLLAQEGDLHYEKD